MNTVTGHAKRAAAFVAWEAFHGPRETRPPHPPSRRVLRPKELEALLERAADRAIRSWVTGESYPATVTPRRGWFERLLGWFTEA